MDRKTDYEKLCYLIASQDNEKQTEILEMIKNDFSIEAYQALLIGVSYFRMLMNNKLKEAMQKAICPELYKEFTGKELEL